MSCKYRLDGGSADPRPNPKNTQRVKDAGDVPFIFSPELEAATAAKLKAALQSTPTPTSSMGMNPFPMFTSGTGLNYATMEDACASDHFYFISILDFDDLEWIVFLACRVICARRLGTSVYRSISRWRSRR